ncbi:FkbM family methyltransferase [Sinorhizobium sp. 8-89]|uniref:FkbM family methyltransferase n=1 Tax=Sinorhizobium sp. 7-81 TaxID=3049087 RepID=UPI0024C2C4AC|nr:FkbM family methyltransferase [Sinorhizobium sp. 7-81]MDK1386371.1 FkbM family methyltransferase [Sinorhizobium sp. 7-81]
MTETISIPAGYRLERGLMWPAEDRACAAVVFDTVPDMDHALKHCRKFELVVQAGGNMGVWALALAQKFERVVTFEPDPRNFRALVHNTASAENILALPCALGSDGGDWCGLDLAPHETNNAGAYQVTKGVTAPIVTIDSLNLPSLDLLYLDIEGFEMPAILGAMETIDKFRPVIAIEDKGLSDRYGYQKGAAENALATFGYEVVARPHRDVVMVARA